VRDVHIVVVVWVRCLPFVIIETLAIMNQITIATWAINVT